MTAKDTKQEHQRESCNATQSRGDLSGIFNTTVGHAKDGKELTSYEVQALQDQAQAAAVICIQARCRGRQGRRRAVRMIKERVSAAMKMQAHTRRYIVRGRLQCVNSFATTIQSGWRAKQARLQVEMLRMQRQEQREREKTEQFAVEALHHAESAALDAAEQAAAVAEGAALSPLHRSAERGDLFAVLALLGANNSEGSESVEEFVTVNNRDQFGCTALHYSSSAQVTEALLAAGADVDARDADGLTPLHHASALGLDSDAVGVALLRAGANTSCCDQMQRTALSYACAEEDCGKLAHIIVRNMMHDEELARTGTCRDDDTDCNEGCPTESLVGLDKDANGWTPLQHAVTHGRIEATIVLLDATRRPLQTNHRRFCKCDACDAENLEKGKPHCVPRSEQDLIKMAEIARENGHQRLAQLLAIFHRLRQPHGAHSPTTGEHVGRVELSANSLGVLVMSPTPIISAMVASASQKGKGGFDVLEAVTEVGDFVLSQRHAFASGLALKTSSSTCEEPERTSVCWVGLLTWELCRIILQMHSRSPAVGLLSYINYH